jgi:hypothetical protein
MRSRSVCRNECRSGLRAVWGDSLGSIKEVRPISAGVGICGRVWASAYAFSGTLVYMVPDDLNSTLDRNRDGTWYRDIPAQLPPPNDLPCAFPQT